MELVSELHLEQF